MAEFPPIPPQKIDAVLYQWDERVKNNDRFSHQDLFLLIWDLVVIKNELLGKNWREELGTWVYGNSDPIQLGLGEKLVHGEPMNTFVNFFHWNQQKRLHEATSYNVKRTLASRHVKHIIRKGTPWGDHRDIQDGGWRFPLKYDRTSLPPETVDQFAHQIWSGYINDRILVPNSANP